MSENKVYWWHGTRSMKKEFHPLWGKEQSEHQKKKIREWMLNMPKKFRERLRTSKLGKLNPNYGKVSPNRRPCEYKGVKYPSVAHMAKALNSSRNWCRELLRKQV